jgi:16S rRNA (cytidine1402-2'-O)-methyltransferase
MPGKLYLIPTGLSDDALDVIPAYVLELTQQLNHFFVEDERSVRRYLRKSGYARHFDDVVLLPLNEHSDAATISKYADELMAEHDWGLMSEAGVPAVADPGHSLVRIAHERNIKVIPLVGPSSIILALMASGLNGQQFCFHGYLPVKQGERMKKIREIELESKSGETQIFIETPYRNQSLLNDILSTCRDETYLCVAVGLTGAHEMIRTKKIGEWKREQLQLDKTPAMFLIGNFTP